jgi:uncharacterized protein YggU (UPF0235/DUF167 family)
VLGVVAAALGIATSALELASGARGREKRILVHGLSAAIARAKLATLLGV